MDVTYNNVLESTRQYFQGVPPAASGVGHSGHLTGGGGGGGLGLFSNIPSSGQQPQANGPTNYYHQAHQQQAHQQQAHQQQAHQQQAHQQQAHQQQAHQQQAHQQQSHLQQSHQQQVHQQLSHQQQAHHQTQHQAVQQRHAAVQQQVQPVPSYLTNGGLGSTGKPIYSPSPQHSPSPHHQENLRIPPGSSSKSMYNPHPPQPSPSPQEHRLSANSASKSMYNPHPQPSPSPQENVRLSANSGSKSMYNPHPQPSPSPQENVRLSANNASKSMYNPHPQPSPSPQENIRLSANNASKSMYNPHPQPSPSPQENIRISASKSMYNPHPQPSPSPQENVRLSVNSGSKSMYNPHPQPSPSPQENIRLPSMSPFNNISYQSQLQQAQRNRLTPTAPSPLPPISQLKGHTAASPSPAVPSGNYQRQINGQGGRYGPGTNYYHTSYQHQSLLQQQHDLQQQQQQLQQQLHQQQQEELKQQQAFYSGLTNSSQQHHPQHHPTQPQHHTPNQYTPSNLSTAARNSTTPVNAGVNLSRTPTSSSNSAAAAGIKRESPLDLSVKTVRQSADSTGQMESSSSESGTTYYYFQQEGMRHPSLPSVNNQQQGNFQSYATLQPATTPKVDFSPNFSQHAHILQSHQQQQQHHHHQPPQSQPQHHQSHRQQQVQSQQHSSLAHHQQASHLHHQQAFQSHALQQSYDKQRWKDSGQGPYQLPSMSSVVKGAGGNHGSHLAGGNHTGMAGTSGNVNHLSGHYHVNQLGQSIPKPTYPQDPSRYAQNYLKRPPSVDQSKMSAPTAPKQSRNDKDWKATIDQQIEKRFNSYLSSKGIVNGDMGKPATPATPTPPTSYPMPASRNYYDHQQVPNQHPQHSYPLEKSNTGPGNGAADKRVLSILRNSLETKEARLQQQQMVKSPLQYTELTTRPAASAQQPHSQGHRHSLPAIHSANAALERGPPTAFPRLSIPKAVNSIQESSKNMPPYHGSNQHLPALLHHQPSVTAHQQQQQQQQQHAMMAQRQPNLTSGKASSEVVDISEDEDVSALARLSASKQSVPQAPNTSQAPAHPGSSQVPTVPPTSKSGEFDGLAAFLAARIRTKAELKQQPSSDQSATPGSSSLTSASLSSSNFRSPYNDLVKTPGTTSDMISSNSKCSPWASSPKMTKDQPLTASFPRRRLFSKGEEDQPSNADSEVPPVGALPPTSASLPPRASSSHRSSSETSVFDFRESDSEGEAPTLERQPGRRPSVSSTPSVVPPPPSTPSKEIIFPTTALEEELKPEEEGTYEEWLIHVEDLLAQLEKDRLKRAKFFGKKPSVRGGKGGGRGAGFGDRPRPPAIVLEVKPLPTNVIKQEVPTDAEESSSSVMAPLQAAPSAVIKEEVVSEPESPCKESSTPQVTPEIKLEFKERRGSGGKRAGRGRGRGGGPGSRGGRGGRTKKPVFGDGSDFKSPGWEEELYKFKKSLRMPPRLINISRPPDWPKAPLSLPDLEVYPDSPCTNDSVETFPGKSKVEKDEKKDDKKPKEDDKKSIAKSLGEDQSFLDRLMAKYTARKKKIKKESPTKTEPKEEDIPELLPTPSLHGSKDPSFLGFRKETIQEYRAEFLKTGTFTAEVDMPPTILETRTRTENKLFKERLTIKEVFGTERPASAPPPGTTTDDLRRRQRLRKNKQKEKKKRMMVRAKKEKIQQKIGSGKHKTIRRKLKSSGFDYIRKPKKKIPGPKKDSDHPHKPRKKKVPSMTEEEIEETIKSWTLNKGVGETVLHRASKNGLIDVVRYLLDKLEQDPSPRDNAGYTPLHEACSRGHVAVAHLLLNYGASVEDSALGGVRPLHEAAENGFTKVVRLLLDYGADPLLATYSGATALSLAAAEEESRLLMETHIAHNGSVPSSILDDIASVPNEAALDGFEIEESDFALPTLYRLSGESRVDSWVLFHELAPHIKVKTKEALAKILKQDSGTVIREIKLHDFFAKAHSRAIKSAPPTECPNKTPKLILVKYTDEIKELLGVETTIIPR